VLINYSKTPSLTYRVSSLIDRSAMPSFSVDPTPLLDGCVVVESPVVQGDREIHQG
jgi:hypothetical protein